jgi:hypothetical protein
VSALLKRLLKPQSTNLDVSHKGLRKNQGILAIYRVFAQKNLAVKQRSYRVYLSFEFYNFKKYDAIIL